MKTISEIVDIALKQCDFLNSITNNSKTVAVINRTIVDGEDYISSDEDVEKQKQDIHAKIYIRRKYHA